MHILEEALDEFESNVMPAMREFTNRWINRKYSGTFEELPSEIQSRVLRLEQEIEELTRSLL